MRIGVLNEKMEFAADWAVYENNNASRDHHDGLRKSMHYLFAPHCLTVTARKQDFRSKWSKYGKVGQYTYFDVFTSSFSLGKNPMQTLICLSTTDWHKVMLIHP